jgi:hypothetical protein
MLYPLSYGRVEAVLEGLCEIFYARTGQASWSVRLGTPRGEDSMVATADTLVAEFVAGVDVPSPQYAVAGLQRRRAVPRKPTRKARSIAEAERTSVSQ